MDMGTISTNNTKLTQHHKEIIEGLLISDGSICKPSVTPFLAVTSIHSTFVEHIKNILPFSGRTGYSKEYDKIGSNGNDVHCQRLHYYNSRTNQSLFSFYNRWYVTGQKIVPNDFVITPTTLLYWFLGDGFSIYREGTIKRLKYIGLCTNGFTYEENEKLCQILRMADPDLKALVKPHMGSHRLIFTTYKAMEAFYGYIGECSLSCFEYKWKELVVLRPRFNPVLLPEIDVLYKSGMSYCKIQNDLRMKGIIIDRHTIAKYHKRLLHEEL